MGLCCLETRHSGSLGVPDVAGDWMIRVLTVQEACPLGFRGFSRPFPIFSRVRPGGLVDVLLFFSPCLSFFFDLYMLMNQIKDGLGCEGYD